VWKLISEWRRPEILIPAQVVADAVDADCLPVELRDALIRGVSVREDVCTGMRPWLMVLGAFLSAAGGAFIAIAAERRKRAPSAASLLAASRRADQQEGLALVESNPLSPDGV
jgi:hypothetical protein